MTPRRSGHHQERLWPITGLHHVLLNVQNLQRSTEFYSQVIGLNVLRRIPDESSSGAKTLFALPDGSMLGLVEHSGGNGGSFDEMRIGLNHLALVVPLAELGEWNRRLRETGFAHSPPGSSPVGDPVIALRDPDNIHVQIYGRGSPFLHSIRLPL